MKFLIFNVVVVAALVHLYAGKNITFDKLGDWFKGPTGQTAYFSSEGTADTAKRKDLFGSLTPEKTRPVAPAASALTAQPETKKMAIRTAATLPETDPVGTAPAAEPLPAELRSELIPAASPMESATKKSKRSAPSPQAQRRRAEIIGHTPVATVNNGSPLPSRRQKLLSMAEEMELFSIEVTQ